MCWDLKHQSVCKEEKVGEDDGKYCEIVLRRCFHGRV